MKIVIIAFVFDITTVNVFHRVISLMMLSDILWNGQDGYQFNIPWIAPATRKPITNIKVWLNDFYSYKLRLRPEQSY